MRLSNNVALQSEAGLRTSQGLSQAEEICSLCPSTKPLFRSRSELNEHLLSTHSFVRCEECGKVFPDQAANLEHQLSMHQSVQVAPLAPVQGEVLPCAIASCDKMFPEANERDKHLLSDHRSDLVRCKVRNCEAAFLVNEHLSHHLIGRHFYQQCEEKDCKKVFPNQRLLGQHQGTNHKNGHASIQCKVKVCSDQFDTEEELNIHLVEKHGYVRCRHPDCLQVFTAKNIKRHERNSHINAKTLECDVKGCKFITKYSDNYRRHRKKKHGIEIEALRKHSNSDQPPKSSQEEKEDDETDGSQVPALSSSSASRQSSTKKRLLNLDPNSDVEDGYPSTGAAAAAAAPESELTISRIATDLSIQDAGRRKRMRDLVVDSESNIKYSCKLFPCEAGFEDLQQFRDHLIKEHDFVLCNHASCQVLCPNIQALANHKQRMHKSMHKGAHSPLLRCVYPTCSEVCHSLADISSHVREVHGDESLEFHA